MTSLKEFGTTEATELRKAIYDNRENPIDMKKSILIVPPQEQDKTLSTEQKYKPHEPPRKSFHLHYYEDQKENKSQNCLFKGIRKSKI